MPTPLLTLPAPPRRVRLLPNPRGNNLPARIVVPLFAVVGIGLSIYCVFLLLAALYGNSLPATVLTTSTQVNGSQTTYFLHFNYTLNGQITSSNDLITKTSYMDFNNLLSQQPQGTPITIHYFRLGPFVHASINSAWTPLVPLAPIVLVWNLAVAAALSTFTLQPLRRRWLCKHGLPTPGSVVSKPPGRKLNHIVYSYQLPTGQAHQQKMRVPRLEDWQSVSPAHPLTILHHPTKPHISTAYELCGYEILPDSPDPSPSA